MVEDVFKNVQVLKGIPVDDFMGTMGIMSAALGFCCSECHTGAGTDLVNWEIDTPRKRTARRMVEMVSAINRENFMGRQVVTCWTCHRGLARPQPLGEALREALDAAGLDSAVLAYRNLRERYYGSAAYDFGEETLNQLGFSLARARRLEAGLGILDLNAEFFPNSPGVLHTRGEAYLVSGDTVSALAAYRRALAADSTGPARFRVRQLTGPRPPR